MKTGGARDPHYYCTQEEFSDWVVKNRIADVCAPTRPTATRHHVTVRTVLAEFTVVDHIPPAGLHDTVKITEGGGGGVYNIIYAYIFYLAPVLPPSLRDYRPPTPLGIPIYTQHPLDKPHTRTTKRYFSD